MMTQRMEDQVSDSITTSFVESILEEENNQTLI